jgi:hypothetical protein
MPRPKSTVVGSEHVSRCQHSRTKRIRSSTTTSPRGLRRHTPPSPRPKRSRVFTRSYGVGEVTQRRPQEGHDTHRHRRRWCRSTRLSPEKNLRAIPRTHGPLDAIKPDLHDTFWMPPLPKHHQHQDSPLPILHHPHGRRKRATTTATPLAGEPYVQSTSQGRRPGIPDLTPEWQQTPLRQSNGTNRDASTRSRPAWSETHRSSGCRHHGRGRRRSPI